MIEKLKYQRGVYEGDTEQINKLTDKINEIIDHLPQEKEDACKSCLNYCKGERVMDTCPNYLAQEKEALFNPQPTKEVPGIDAQLEDCICLYTKKHCVECACYDWCQVAKSKLKEISALYRKEK